MLGLGLMVVIHGCKPIDHSKSEEKFWKTSGKSTGDLVAKLGGDASEETLSGIGKLASKNSDDKYWDELRKVLIKGGKNADKAVIAYYRGHKKQLKKIFKGYYKRNLESLRTGNDLSMVEEIRFLDDIVTDLTSMYGAHQNKVEKIINDITDPKMKFQLAEKLDISDLFRSRLGDNMSPSESIINLANKIGGQSPGRGFFDKMLKLESLVDMYGSWLDDLAQMAGITRQSQTVKEGIIDTKFSIDIRE